MRENFELLLPAGSFKALELAIYNGADAVYLGLSNFSARAKAENFNIDELKSAVEFAHLYGKKIYVAVNTLIKSFELYDCIKAVEEAYLVGVDAVIIQSLSLGVMIKDLFPNLDIHVSTQAGIHNNYGAEFIKKLGFSRVILSRETTFEDIKTIANIPNLETEVFIHGALCTSFSGGCYMSSFISQNSGNRGRCLQPCRLKYQTEDGQNAYLLSLSDMHLGEKVNELMSLGVKSFKVEGRMRRPEYAGYAARYYNKILSGQKPDKKEFENLSGLYNRGGFTYGHYFGDQNIASIKAQGHTGYAAAQAQKAVNIKGNKKLLVKKIDGISGLNDGDGFKIMRSGVEVGSAYFNAKENEALSKEIIKEKNEYLLSYNGEVAKGDIINRTTDFALISEIADFKTYIAIDISLIAFPYKKAVLEVSFNDIKVSIQTDSEVQVAEKQIDLLQIKERLSRTGDTFFTVKNIDVKVNGYIPLKELNNIRRIALEKLKIEIIKSYNNKFLSERLTNCFINENHLNKYLKSNKEFKNTEKVNISVISKSEVVLSDKDINFCIYKPDDYSIFEFDKFFCNTQLKDIYLYLPRITNGKDLKIIESLITKYKISGIFAENIGQVEFAKALNLKVYGGTGLNIFSKADEVFYSQYLNNFTASSELSLKEAENLNCDYFAYGDIPLMALNHCIYKAYTNKSCNICDFKNPFYITDRKNIKFEVKRFKLSKCYFVVLNSKQLNIFNKKDYLKLNSLLIDVSTLPKEEAIKLINNLHNKNSLDFSFEESSKYTSGHAYRGVF